MILFVRPRRGSIKCSHMHSPRARDPGRRWSSASISGLQTDILVSSFAGNTLLSVAAQNGNKSIIKALLRRGAGLNTQNHKGQTALHFCFTYGYTDLGNYLISKGADDTIENLACLTCYEGLNAESVDAI